VNNRRRPTETGSIVQPLKYIVYGKSSDKNSPHRSDYAVFKLSIRQSKIHRYGVYARELIPSNRKVIEYVRKRRNRREAIHADHTYLFVLDKCWSVDGHHRRERRLKSSITVANPT
jgi:hypothetical protein